MRDSRYYLRINSFYREYFIASSTLLTKSLPPALNSWHKCVYHIPPEIHKTSSVSSIWSKRESRWINQNNIRVVIVVCRLCERRFWCSLLNATPIYFNSSTLPWFGILISLWRYVSLQNSRKHKISNSITYSILVFFSHAAIGFKSLRGTWGLIGMGKHRRTLLYSDFKWINVLYRLTAQTPGTSESTVRDVLLYYC